MLKGNEIPLCIAIEILRISSVLQTENTKARAMSKTKDLIPCIKIN